MRDRLEFEGNRLGDLSRSDVDDHLDDDEATGPLRLDDLVDSLLADDQADDEDEL